MSVAVSTAVVHFVPCSTTFRGTTNVEHNFKMKPLTGSGSGSAKGAGAFTLFEGQVVPPESPQQTQAADCKSNDGLIVAHLRGRRLIGRRMTLPQESVGYILLVPFEAVLSDGDSQAVSVVGKKRPREETSERSAAAGGSSEHHDSSSGSRSAAGGHRMEDGNGLPTPSRQSTVCPGDLHGDCSPAVSLFESGLDRHLVNNKAKVTILSRFSEIHVWEHDREPGPLVRNAVTLWPLLAAAIHQGSTAVPPTAHHSV